MPLQQQCGEEHGGVWGVADGGPISEGLMGGTYMTTRVRPVPWSDQIVIRVVARFLEAKKSLDHLNQGGFEGETQDLIRWRGVEAQYAGFEEGSLAGGEGHTDGTHVAVIMGALDQRAQFPWLRREKPPGTLGGQKVEQSIIRDRYRAPETGLSGFPGLALDQVEGLIQQIVMQGQKASLSLDTHIGKPVAVAEIDRVTQDLLEPVQGVDLLI